MRALGFAARGSTRLLVDEVVVTESTGRAQLGSNAVIYPGSLPEVVLPQTNQNAYNCVGEWYFTNVNIASA